MNKQPGVTEFCEIVTTQEQCITWQVARNVLELRAMHHRNDLCGTDGLFLNQRKLFCCLNLSFNVVQAQKRLYEFVSHAEHHKKVLYGAS